MTTSSRAAFDVPFWQQFTKRHVEFISGNASVTAGHPAGGVSQHSHSNRTLDDLANTGRAMMVRRNP